LRESFDKAVFVGSMRSQVMIWTRARLRADIVEAGHPVTVRVVGVVADRYLQVDVGWIGLYRETSHVEMNAVGC
jgi:hypothetical protein